MQLFELPLFVVLWGYLTLQASALRYRICNTPGCLRAAEMVRQNMDVNVDPCSNFYEYACGRYVKRERVASDKTQICSFVTVDETLQKQLVKMLESPPPANEPKPFKMARNLYNICMRPDLMDKRGLDFMVGMTKRAGGWPVLVGDNWASEKFDWVEMIYKLHDFGLSGALFDFSVGIDLANSFKHVLEVDQADPGLNREYMVQGRGHIVVETYARYMVDIVHMFGVDLEVAKREMSDALDFEIEMAKISMSQEELRNSFNQYNPMRIQDLQARHPIVNWKQYAMRMMNNVTALLPDEVIILNTPKYLDSLINLIKSTANRTLANYIMWRAVRDTIGLLTKAIRDRHHQFSREITGREDHEARWEECLGTVTRSLPLAIGAWYVRNFFHEKAKTNAVDIVERIRKEMVAILKEVDWMDEDTKAKAIDKAQAMTKHIAYPSEHLEDVKIEKFYSRLEITGENFFESMMNVSRFGWEYSLSKLRERINKTAWEMHAHVAVINAFYNPVENSIQFPAGILQDVFFSHDRPRYMNYGAIGSIIGHEISHGFDDMGSQFDHIGNLALWWKPQTKEEFEKRMQCFIDQASNYTVRSVNLTLNGVTTQGENSADSGGCKLSANAYDAWVKEHQEEPRLQGLEEYSPRQMFWLSAANVWCTVYRPATLRLQITVGEHSPAEYRVNGAFRNQERFAKDFNCPPGSEMNPAHKCHVW